jgi:hypothetical protein
VKPSTGARKTLKAWLKDQKSKVDKEAAAAVAIATESIAAPLTKQGPDGSQHVETNGLEPAIVEAGKPSLTSTEAVDEELLPSVEVRVQFYQRKSLLIRNQNAEETAELHPEQMEAGDDDVEFQVEPDQDDPNYEPLPDLEQEEEEQRRNDLSRHGMAQTDNSENQDGQDGIDAGHNTNVPDFGSFNNPMLQQMQQMTQMLGGFNPMMGAYTLPFSTTPYANLTQGCKWACQWVTCLAVSGQMET